MEDAAPALLVGRSDAYLFNHGRSQLPLRSEWRNRRQLECITLHCFTPASPSRALRISCWLFKYPLRYACCSGDFLSKPTPTASTQSHASRICSAVRTVAVMSVNIAECRSASGNGISSGATICTIRYFISAMLHLRSGPEGEPNQTVQQTAFRYASFAADLRVGLSPKLTHKHVAVVFACCFLVTLAHGWLCRLNQRK